MAADIAVFPGVDSASKNEYQDIPGGKGGRCVRVTTLPPSCSECLVIWSLNRPEPSGPHRPVIGIALPYLIKTYGLSHTLKFVQTLFTDIVRLVGSSAEQVHKIWRLQFPRFLQWFISW